MHGARPGHYLTHITFFPFLLSVANAFARKTSFFPSSSLDSASISLESSVSLVSNPSNTDSTFPRSGPKPSKLSSESSLTRRFFWRFSTRGMWKCAQALLRLAAAAGGAVALRFFGLVIGSGLSLESCVARALLRRSDGVIVSSTGSGVGCLESGKPCHSSSPPSRLSDLAALEAFEALRCFGWVVDSLLEP